MTVVGRFISQLINIYVWLLIIRVLLSWFPLPNNELLRTVYEFLYKITEPYLRLFRSIIPSLGAGGGGIDFSPMVAIIVLLLLRRVAVIMF